MRVKGLYSVYGRFYATDSMSLAVRKWFVRLNVIFRTSNVFVNVNAGVKNHNFKFPLILDKINIMIVMQKLKFMQEFTSDINVECPHSKTTNA